jgi:hypothetical protein
MNVRRYWLSFVDTTRPEGEGFLGAAVVEVNKDEAAAAKVAIDEQFPNHAEGAEWVAAASLKAWLLGCNPGGEMATADITDAPVPEGIEVPLGRLLQKDELQQLGLI